MPFPAVPTFDPTPPSAVVSSAFGQPTRGRHSALRSGATEGRSGHLGRFTVIKGPPHIRQPRWLWPRAGGALERITAGRSWPGLVQIPRQNPIEASIETELSFSHLTGLAAANGQQRMSRGEFPRVVALLQHSTAPATQSTSTTE